MKILLADDQLQVRTAVRLYLAEQAEFELSGEVTHADAWLTAIDTLCPEVLLLDWELAGLRTTCARQQLISARRARPPQLYFIVLSSNHQIEHEALPWGINAFVDKAKPPIHLIAAIQAATRSNAHADPVGLITTTIRT